MPLRSPGPREGTLILGVFAAALAWSAGVSAYGWSHAISDWYGWRQTQTAISALFMLRGGPWLDYQLPIFGPPWQLPHEFPLYQALVVALASASGLRLEAAGRAVSVSFFYAALAAAYLLLGELGVAPRRRLLVLAFWLLSPLYLFWSRTFMVESTALCLCLAFLAFHARFLARGRPMDGMAALVAGCLGAAVKPPTVLVFAGFAGLWWLLAQRRGTARPGVRLFGVLLTLLPPLAGWAWQQHADALKASNPLASYIGSGQLLRDWVFSGLHRRWEPALLVPVWERGLPYTLGHWTVAAAALAGVLVARRRRAQFSLACAGFLAHYAAFAPLDSTQHYYWYGAGVFLVAAAGLAAVALLECGDARRHLAWVLAAAVAASGVHGYRSLMLPFQRHDANAKPDWPIRLARAVAAATGPDDVIVGFGLDWNPEVPYYAGRRALMWPRWSDASAGSSEVDRALAGLDGLPVGALFNCPQGAPEATVERFRQRWRLVPSPSFEARCKLYVRASDPPAPPPPAGPAAPRVP